LELDLCCRGRGQSVCAAQPGTFRTRYSPPSPRLRSLEQYTDSFGARQAEAGKRAKQHTLRVSPRNARPVMAERIENGDPASTVVPSTCERYSL
jgi:hypothetical protein